MNKQKLDKIIQNDAEPIAKKLQSTKEKLQKIYDDRLTIAKAMKAYKKNRDIKVLLEYFNDNNENEDSDNISTVNLPGQVMSKIKLERDSHNIPADSTLVEISGSIKEEPNLMPPPTIRPKRGRKKAVDTASSSSSGTSTRSSTRSTRLNSVRESDVECTEPVLECLSVSDEEALKSDQGEVKEKITALKRSKRTMSTTETTLIKTEKMPPPPIRYTRSKRIQNKVNPIKDDIITENTAIETETIIRETDIAPETAVVNGVKYTNEVTDNKKLSDGRSKRLRSPFSAGKMKRTSKHSKSEYSTSPVDCDTSGQTVYEDAADTAMASCKFKMNAVVMLENINVPPPKLTMANETFNIPTTNSNSANETVIIPTRDPMSEKKGDNFNGLEDIMTDDESPTTATKSELGLGEPSSLTQSKVLKKATELKSLQNRSPVKKLVLVFEEMGKRAGDESKARETPTNMRQMRNTTPTQQNKPYTANGSASNSHNPSSAVKSLGLGTRLGSSSATVSAIKRSQQEYQERELLRRQKEKEIKRKREQHAVAQVEERRKRVEAQELKMLQVQQKKEMLNQQKMQHLDELQRMKEEKTRLVLQEKQERIDKHKEDLEKKRLKYKKNLKDDGASANKPIYMMQPMPLLVTADCYDSDEENAKIKCVRVKPSWTMKDQLHQALSIMAKLNDDRVKKGLFMTKACTPNLADIFQDIDPAKLGRSSSAVWRKPPRYTLMHLPSFTEEAEHAE